MLLLAGASVNAQNLVYRIGTASAITSATVEPNYTAEMISSLSPLTAGIGLTAESSKTWKWNGFFSSSKESAILNNDYWTWSFSTSSDINLNQISLSLDRTIPGPASFFLGYDINPVATNNANYLSYIQIIQSTVGSSGQTYTQSFNDLPLKAGEKITFVITAWSGAGSLRLLNSDALGDPDSGFEVYNGLSGIAVTATIPEPSSLSLLLAGGAVLMASRRTRRA